MTIAILSTIPNIEIVGGDDHVTSPILTSVLVKVGTAERTGKRGDPGLKGRERAVEAILTHRALPGLVGEKVRRIEDI